MAFAGRLASGSNSPPLIRRSILYASSSLELSFHESFASVGEMAVATRFDGALEAAAKADRQAKSGTMRMANENMDVEAGERSRGNPV